MTHSKRNCRVLYAIDNSPAVCFALTVPYCTVWHVSISNPVSRSELIMQPDGNYNHLPSIMAAVTRSLPSEIRFMQCLIFRPVFLFYFSSERCKEVIAFVLSSQWKTLIWCFCPMCPIQILAFVSSVMTAAVCLRLTVRWTVMLLQTEMWLLRPRGMHWEKIVGGYLDEMSLSHIKAVKLN